MAKWDAGSEEAFVAKMNARATELGMAHTHNDDASGFSTKTVSTPSDLLIVGALAMENPVFRQTVAMAQATLPVAGVVHNVNSILGKDGNIGIKTGTTDEAGGCFVSASIQQRVASQMNLTEGHSLPHNWTLPKGVLIVADWTPQKASLRGACCL